MGVWTIYVQPFRDQHQASQLIQKCNGSIQAETADGSAWQRWLVVRMLGEDQFVHVLRVDLRNAKPNTETLELLQSLRFVRQLYLDHTETDDGILKKIASLPELRVLSLSYTKVTHEGLESLNKRQSLKKLYLTGTNVNDRSVETLNGFDSLQQLFLRWTKVTEQGVAQLRSQLPNCQVHHHRFKVSHL